MGIIKIILFVIIFVLILGAIKTIISTTKGRQFFNWRSRKNSFIADELYKLNELKRRGIISEEEFEIQKRKLIK